MAKKKSNRNKRKSGGTMSGMRAGFKGAVGQGKRRRKKKQPDFITVLLTLFGIGLLVVFIWRMTM